MGMATLSVREHLDSANWSELYPRLFNYARRKTNALKFLHTPGELPLGQTGEDLVQKAIDKVFSGDRKWDPNKNPDLYAYLTSVVDSLLSGLLHKVAYRNNSSQDLAEIAGSNEVNYNDCFEALETLVKDACSDDENLDNIRNGLEDGMTSGEISEFFGIEIQMVYTLTRKLRRRIDRKMKLSHCYDQWKSNI